jgi:ketosteroid isomerase-like protein
MARPHPDRSSAETVRTLFGAYFAGSVDDALSLLHPDVVIEPLHRPGRSVYHGHDGARLFLDDLRRTPALGRVEFHDFVELPDGRVEARGHQVTTTDEGKEIRVPVTPTVTLRDGLVVHLQGWSADDD